MKVVGGRVNEKYETIKRKFKRNGEKDATYSCLLTHYLTSPTILAHKLTGSLAHQFTSFTSSLPH